MEQKDGMLTVCATPVGNRQDMTPRALEALRQADMIAAEDTRHTGQLLSAFGIRGHMVPYHRHNRASREEELLTAMQNGAHVVLVSDAGTPCISDPGWELVAAAVEAGIRVTAVPGASALPLAVALSGFNMERFVFEGFLPRTGRERQERLREIAQEKRGVVIYESPHRIAATVEALAAMQPLRRAAVMRELTKMYEEVHHATLDELSALLHDAAPRGEFVLVLSPYEAPRDDEDPRALLEAYRESGVSRKEAVVQAAQRCALPRNTVYQMAMGMDWPPVR